jgi:hypothetical protein
LSIITNKDSLRSSHSFLVSHSSELWHALLGHPGHGQLHHILSTLDFHCSRSDTHSCSSCRLGKHVRLSFFDSSSVSLFPFQLLHCDVWTSPIISNSGFKFYLVIPPQITEPNMPPAPPSKPFVEIDVQPLDPVPSAPMHNDLNMSLEIPAATHAPSHRTTASTSAAPHHHMITHACDGIRQPNPRYANTAVTTHSPAPSSVHATLCDPD